MKFNLAKPLANQRCWSYNQSGLPTPIKNSNVFRRSSKPLLLLRRQFHSLGSKQNTFLAVLVVVNIVNVRQFETCQSKVLLWEQILRTWSQRKTPVWLKTGDWREGEFGRKRFTLRPAMLWLSFGLLVSLKIAPSPH